MLAPSPEPPWNSAAVRLSGVAKSAPLTATRLLGQKSVSFYGSYMIRPPRWAAKTAAVSIRRTAPAGAANADVQKKIFFSAPFSPVPRPAARFQSRRRRTTSFHSSLFSLLRPPEAALPPLPYPASVSLKSPLRGPLKPSLPYSGQSPDNTKSARSRLRTGALFSC